MLTIISVIYTVFMKALTSLASYIVTCLSSYTFHYSLSYGVAFVKGYSDYMLCQDYMTWILLFPVRKIFLHLYSLLISIILLISIQNDSPLLTLNVQALADVHSSVFTYLHVNKSLLKFLKYTEYLF